jgi:hypothetical protein
MPPKTIAADEPTATAAEAKNLVDDMTLLCLVVEVVNERRRQGRADSGISTGAGPALGVAGAAGAAGAGAAAAGVAAGVDAGSRPASGVPAGIKEARPVGIDDRRFCGAVAGAAAAAGVFIEAGMPGNAAGGCGSVTDAVAAGGEVTGAAGAAGAA